MEEKDETSCPGNPLDEFKTKAKKVFQQESDHTRTGLNIVERTLDVIHKAFRNESENDLEEFFNYQLTLLEGEGEDSISTNDDSKPSTFNMTIWDENFENESLSNGLSDEIMKWEPNKLAKDNRRIGEVIHD